MTGLLSVFVLAASTFAPPSAPSAPALCSNSPASVMQADFEGGGTTDAVCFAECGPQGPPISCTGYFCTSVDRSCPDQRGYVSCDGITYYCAECCTEGQIRNVTTGPTCSCPDGMTTPKDRYQCVNGDWEYQFSFCGAPFCQG